MKTPRIRFVTIGTLAIIVLTFAATGGSEAQDTRARQGVSQSGPAPYQNVGQKFCVATSKAGWRATLNVPSPFTARGCEDYSRQIGADDYVLGCLTGIDQVSVGTGGPGFIGHGSPSPNCGW
jgi:hypothetical protein